MIKINMSKAKDIGHTIRRQMRTEEFKPFDTAIAAQLPGTDMEKAEEARQAIRDKYAIIQTKIDTAETTEQIKEALAA